MGMFTMEELVWGDAAHPWAPPGHLLSDSLCQAQFSYLVPSPADVPREFNVSLLSNAPNVKAVHSSKAVGEPPLFLASSVFFAIKDALSASRLSHGRNGWFPLDTPATAERIRLASGDVEDVKVRGSI
mmetsp:Transcript_2456/g.5120  ORF Transcript_2456/g.5120 Transcript_2456/m.5120 type:complete len:128 (+) Transcript_2456:571-954(+)